MVKELICFDMDNTLIDADKVHVIAFNKAFKKNGLKRVKAKKLKPLFGIIGTKLVKELFPNLPKSKVKKIVEDHNNFLVSETKKYSRPFKGVKGTLKKLRKKYRIGLVSNCTHKEILALLKTSKLNKKLFDVIIGNDEVKHPKPAPDEIVKAERLLHIKADYMVGDTVYDIRAGKKAKVKTIAVLTGNHKKEELEKEKPDMILKSVNELPKVI